MATVILLKTDDITKQTPVGGGVDGDRIIPAIKTAQESNIRQLLGVELYKKIQQDFENETLDGVYKELYEDYLKGMLIHLSTAYYFTYGAYQIGNKGIYKANSDTSVGINKGEVDYMVKAQEKSYKDYKKQFFKWIKTVEIPEYEENKAVKNHRKVGNWVLSKPKLNNINECF